MTYKRLTSQEKAEIVVAYGQGATIKDLATKFAVSENTIRRTIKSGEQEPAAPQVVAKISPSTPAEDIQDVIVPPATSALPTASLAPPRLIRRKPNPAEQPPSPELPPEPIEVLPPDARQLDKQPPSAREVPLPPEAVPLDDLEEDEITGLAVEDLEDFDEDFDEDEDEEEGESNDPTEAAEMLAENPSAAEIPIYPLEAAILPRPCYVVIDTRSELLARPLAEFRGLGHTSQDEEQQKTLPIFESRGVALRFSQRNQRIYKNSDSILRKTVVKVPDGNILRKTSPYLQEKGITRLLIHGQVYALE